MIKITTLFIPLFMALIIASCSPAISQQEYDRVSNELSTVQSQLESLQIGLEEVETLKAQNEELSKQNDTVMSELESLQAKYEELGKQKDTVTSELESLQAKYEELSSEYQELSKQPDVIVEEPTEILEEDLEQVIFELINQERKDNGLDELIWGVNLYKAAQNNCKKMATNRILEYSAEVGSYNELIRVTGYTETQRMAESIFTIWENTDRYELEFLNSITTYGAVAAYKSGEIFYITYISGVFR